MKVRGLSVIICTFNGAARIERVLTALTELNSGTAHEIILVDNCSTDGVAAVACAVWTRIGPPSVDFRVISEPTPGLSAARRAGARAATREIIVFCDDDNLLAPDYLEIAVSIMADETIGAAGGMIANNGRRIPTVVSILCRLVHGGRSSAGQRANQWTRRTSVGRWVGRAHKASGTTI